MEPELNCPCTKACPRHGDCAACVRWHLKTPPEDIVFCMRPKAAQRYGQGKTAGG